MRRGLVGSIAAGSTLAALALLGNIDVPHLSGQASQQTPPASPQDTLQLVFEREVFTYPDHARRNPFRPLTGEDTGPRFEELRLLGVIVSPQRDGSVALLGAGATSGGDTGRSFRVREGQALGNIRVLAIRQREIVVQVDEFGVYETRVMPLRRALPDAFPTDVDPDDDDDDDEPPSPPPGGTGAAGAEPDTTGAPGANGNGGSR